jgi:hypothetical protein
MPSKMLKKWFCSTKEKQEAERKEWKRKGLLITKNNIYWTDGQAMRYKRLRLKRNVRQITPKSFHER